ncbi:MAG: BMP family ABC transporter substrate-binding protein [Undibacterium sp.]|uniref:BMP family lipoprotein n=1 Tax=Undibacterium sp. TaxID=1914977 RepID=UPI002726A363|nr:BMP family ABC transporter substrate-binding protein [Undibacterium sp.]MDO8651366.1 BMP family ABC transporter substrate-binding protein [Undibacterium sp.]
MKIHRLCLVLVSLFSAASVHAADPKLAVIYDAGGKFDKSFNQSASEGAERFKKETKIGYLEVQVANDTQTEQVLRNLARKNVDLIAAIGFVQSQAVQNIAKEFPKTKFVLIDGVASGDNVSSVLFKEQEGSYLVGVAAAMASKSKKLGFVGGMDIPLIRAFACGYAQGAKAVDSKIEVTQNIVGSTASAWNDPAKGGELARAQFERGVDVIFAAAGGSGIGALQAAKEKGKLAIGVDSNQNYMHPGTMLTSMTKRVDQAIYDSFMQVKNGTWKAGIINKGLKEGGVDWALDQDNRKLITPEIEKRVNAAKQDILSGKVKVIDAREANKCPV